MFTKTQLLAIFAVSSAVSVMAAPPGEMMGANGGWIAPTGGSNRAGKIKQTQQVLAVDQHKKTEPNHPAVVPGNTAHVHDHFHSTNGGAKHATVNYKDPAGKHVTTLHIAPDGTRLVGDAPPPLRRQGTSPPRNSPQGSPKRQRRALLARMLGANGGWIEPAKGRGRDGKVRQAHETLAIDRQKEDEPTHPAVAPGNTAHVHTPFHSTQGGPKHTTVKYRNPNGNHVSTLHIAPDGTRLQGSAQQPPHRKGTSPPPNSPANRRREILEFVRRELQLLDQLD